MANFYDQAQAIWNALDTMLDKDPEGYKKFISEQLREGESVLKTDKASETGASSSFIDKLQKTSPKCSSGKDKKMAKNIDSNLNAGPGKRVSVSELTKSNSQASHTNSLTDDAICGANSLLAQMVISKPDPDVDEEESEIALSELKIPTDPRTPTLVNPKRKPLIEEL
ncbi:unnamed protein product [Orchesella dallaii]